MNVLHKIVMVSVRMQGRDGKVVQVYRKRWVIHIERLAREKVNGTLLLLQVSHVASTKSQQSPPARSGNPYKS